MYLCLLIQKHETSYANILRHMGLIIDIQRWKIERFAAENLEVRVSIYEFRNLTSDIRHAFGRRGINAKHSISDTYENKNT